MKSTFETAFSGGSIFIVSAELSMEYLTGYKLLVTVQPSAALLLNPAHFKFAFGKVPDSSRPKCIFTDFAVSAKSCLNYNNFYIFLQSNGIDGLTNSGKQYRMMKESVEK